MALGDLVGRLLGPLIDKIKAALGPFGRVFDLVTNLWHGITGSIEKGKELTDEIITEVGEWRNFKEAIPVRTGVINLPKAIEKSEDLLGQIRASWDSIKDLATQIRDQLRGQQGDPAEEAANAIKDLEQARGITDLLERFPRLARGLEKLLGFLAIVVGTLTAIQSAIDDLKQIVDTIKGIREEIETGDTIFLSHKNPRRTVQLVGGGSMKIRVGNLHS